MDAKDDPELVRRVGEAFAREAEALDSTTLRRLATARRAALEELTAPARPKALGWAPVGAAAVIALAAIGVALTLRPGPEAPGGADASEQGATEMELLLSDDDPALYAEDPDFYAWAAEQGDDAG